MNNQLLSSELALPVSPVSQMDKNQQLNLLELQPQIRGVRSSQQGIIEPKAKKNSFGAIQDIKLSKSSNAWKPSCKQPKEVIDPNAIQTEELYKKVRSILNKLTPQKFQTLVNQVNSLPIDTEERLKGVIDLVFERAIKLDEPNYRVAYANLCRCLAMMKVPLSNKENDYVNFRKLLLNKCQKEFEKNLNDEVYRENKIKDISQSETEEKKKELIEEYEEIERKAKRRSLGNIRFIGELFKLHMLTANIMHDCLKKLLSQEDEDSLECLCGLLTTIGKDMESDKNKGNTENKMNVYFTQMQEIVHKKQTSSRVRFMLQDVIDLRSGNWIPRRDENNPKTIDQIHREAEREAFEREALLQQMSSHRKSDDRDKRKRDTFVGNCKASQQEKKHFSKTFENRPSNISDFTRSMSPVSDDTPEYLTERWVRTQRWQPQIQGGRLSQQGKIEPKAKKNFSFAAIQDIKLSQPSNAWKPSCKQPKEVIDPNVIQTEELYKKMSSILNRLIPQKFQTLVNQVNSLPIDTEERLKGVIDLVFKKAIDEPDFSVAYANLCKCLAMMKVPLGNKENDYVNFRKLLLNKCQKEFEKDLNDEVDRENKIKDISQSESEEKRKQLIEEFEELECKAIRRSLGNIKFIGELFKLHMLTANIMHDCLKKLLSRGDEHSLEGLCILLTTIGKDMESDKNTGNKMNMYFEEMQEIVRKRQISLRICLMVQNVINLRLNNWTPRRNENHPKSIDQFHEETERETFKRETLQQHRLFHHRSDHWNERKISSSPMEAKWLGPHYIAEDEMERRTKLIIDEFLHNNDLREAALNVRKQCSHSTVHLFVTSALNLVMKHSSQARLYVGQLTNFLVKEKIILVEQYIKGLKGISLMAEEYAIDIPNFWRNLSELIVPITQSGTIPLSYLREIAQPCVEVGLAGKLISEVLHALAENMGTQKVGEMWRNSNLTWAVFLSENENEDKFITENRLDFTIARRESLLQPQMSLEEIKEHLTNILQKKKADNEVIFDWIDSHVTESQTKEFAFVRALMTAVVQGVLEDTGTTWNLQEEALRKRCTLLLKYLDHKDEFELEALYALQTLMHQMEHPKSILCQIFDTLYDEDVISKEAFLQWESSDDPAEQEGKGVALSSVRTFYTWLREMNNESPEES